MGLGTVFLTAALLLGQRAIPLGDDPTPDFEEPPRITRPAWVTTAGLPVYVEPEEGAFATARLKAGQKVMTRASESEGWIAIVPPAGSFSWIERDAVDDLGDGRGVVKVQAAAVRPGRNDVSLPTGPWVVLRNGAEVELLDRPPLVLRQGDTRRVWYAIEPPACEVRYINADGVSWSDPALLGEETHGDHPALDFLISRREPIREANFGPIDPEFVAVGPVAREVGLSASFEAALHRIEADHRQMLARPMNAWNLKPIEAAYTRLRDQTDSGNEKQAVELRLSQLKRQSTAAATRKSIQAMLDRSQQRDQEFRRIRERLGTIATGDEGPYDTEGLLQSSSTLLEGRKAFVLIDDAGKIDAYLLLPPGLRVDPYLSTRVGIRGDSRFSSQLKARVITVREVDSLDRAP